MDRWVIIATSAGLVVVLGVAEYFLYWAVAELKGVPSTSERMPIDVRSK